MGFRFRTISSSCRWKSLSSWAIIFWPLSRQWSSAADLDVGATGQDRSPRPRRCSTRSAACLIHFLLRWHPVTFIALPHHALFGILSYVAIASGIRTRERLFSIFRNIVKSHFFSFKVALGCRIQVFSERLLCRGLPHHANYSSSLSGPVAINIPAYAASNNS